MKSDFANPSYRQSSLGLKRSLGLSGHRQQQGVALIVVLLVLILIISIGAVAVRRSQTDLRLVSSSQIDTLLLQGADGANMKLEEAVNRPVRDPIYEDMVNRNNGIFGHFITNASDTNQDELIYCYNPRELQVNTRTATIKRDGGTVSGYGPGECNPNNAKSYISARQTVATQVHITKAPTTAAGPFEVARQGANLSTSGESGTAPANHLFNIETVSAVPAYASSAASPATCYSPNGGAVPVGSSTADNLASCLKGQGVPNKQLMEQVAVELVNNITPCTALGRGSGTIAAGCGTTATP